MIFYPFDGGWCLAAQPATLRFVSFIKGQHPFPGAIAFDSASYMDFLSDVHINVASYQFD